MAGPWWWGVTYHKDFFFKSFFFCLNHCVLLREVGLVWGVYLGGVLAMCSHLRCSLLAKSCLGRGFAGGELGRLVVSTVGSHYGC